MMRLTFPRLLLVIGAALPLAGCINLAPKPPAALLMLTPGAAPAIGQTVSSATAATISIQVPVAPAAISTTRVPVQTSATAFAYVKGAIWSEPPPRLFARLLSDTIAARTGRIVLSGVQALGDPGAKLAGELRSFGVEETSSEAVVVYEATLRRGADRVFEKRRFEAREPVSRIDADSVGPALNRAANRVAADVADWVGK
jgi:cholesterol transport system auxiliary component